MKNINLYIVALTCTLLVTSCESDDKVVIDVLDGKTSGAILRTRSSKGSFDMFRPDKVFEVTVEEQDENNGELIERVNITLDYIDNNTTGDSGDDGVTGVPFGTIAASEFTTGERGLPEADFSYSLQDALDVLDLPITSVLAGDRVQINFELFFTDGRSFNAGDAATTVTGGSFFKSPFLYDRLIDDGVKFTNKGFTANEVNVIREPAQVNEGYTALITLDDEEEGALIETINVYRTFRDLTIDESGTDLSEPEALLQTYTVADLELNESTREVELALEFEDLLGPNLTFEQVSLGDDFRFRYELITTDGRIITTKEPGTEYFVAVPTTECIQLNTDAPVAGEYVIEFADSFGDGLDGAFITVDIDGATTDYTLENGDSGESKFIVPEGTTTLVLTYVAGSFEEEHSYVIVDPNGNDAASDGPNPSPGPISIKVCMPQE